ncbi:hypothetical protein C8R46DRAFT_1125719 [Mycena filopes]|nr:hypothetical protein C8R46DRAFT_1125719 [Mycena filopes]
MDDERGIKFSKLFNLFRGTQIFQSTNHAPGCVSRYCEPSLGIPRANNQPPHPHGYHPLHHPAHRPYRAPLPPPEYALPRTSTMATRPTATARASSARRVHDRPPGLALDQERRTFIPGLPDSESESARPESRPGALALRALPALSLRGIGSLAMGRGPPGHSRGAARSAGAKLCPECARRGGLAPRVALVARDDEDAAPIAVDVVWDDQEPDAPDVRFGADAADTATADADAHAQARGVVGCRGARVGEEFAGWGACASAENALAVSRSCRLPTRVRLLVLSPCMKRSVAARQEWMLDLGLEFSCI